MKVTISFTEDEALLATAIDQTVARLIPKAKHSEEKTDDGGFLRRIVFLTKPPSRSGRKAIYKTKDAISRKRKNGNNPNYRNGNQAASDGNKGTAKGEKRIPPDRNRPAANKANGKRRPKTGSKKASDSGSR